MIKSKRQRLLAAIHVAKKELCLSDDVYQAVLSEVCGAESSKDLTEAELLKLCNHLKSKLPAPKKFKKPVAEFYEIPKGTPHEDQKRYILALWAALGYKVSGIDYRVKKQFGVDKFLWLKNEDHLQTLAKDLNKRCRLKNIDPAA